MDEVTTPAHQEFARFTKHIILGSIFSGLLSSIPIFNCLNCLFCLLNMVGVVFALWLYFLANPTDTLTEGESVGFGAIAGAGAGIIATVGDSLLKALMLGDTIADFLRSILIDQMEAEQVEQILAQINSRPGVGVFLMNIVFYSAFGLLGSFLGVKLFFKNRIRKT